MSGAQRRAVVLFERTSRAGAHGPSRLGVRAQQALMRWAFRDDLTGLLNRRGFRLLASRRLASARRRGRGLLLFYADLDGFKQINDRFGHAEGDRALVRTAASFRKAFRRSDVLARFGGDEFVALVTEEPGCSPQALCRRLQRYLRQADTDGYRLSLTTGVIRFDHTGAPPLEELLAKADGRLYSHKQHRHGLTIVASHAARRE
jgi:diguanylate cyclase (GGDEF)-like protein